MIYLSQDQKETLLLVDKMISENKTFDEIKDCLLSGDYTFRVNVKNGYASKTHFEIFKKKKDENGYIKYDYTFVDLIKRKNGLAYWETIRIS